MIQKKINSKKWVTDYLIKCHTAPNEFWGQVASGHTDHSYWGRPEGFWSFLYYSFKYYTVFEISLGKKSYFCLFDLNKITHWNENHGKLNQISLEAILPEKRLLPLLPLQLFSG